MQSYRAFALLNVRHDYFADGSARHLVFHPHADTSAFMHRFAMLVRADGNSLGISVADSQLPGIWSERLDEGAPRSLRFDVHSADTDSAYYTAELGAQPDAPGEGSRPVPLLPVASSPQAPLATIALPVNPVGTGDFTAWTESLAMPYRLHLQGRSTIWKYLLIGDWRGRALSIVDQRGEVSFTAPAPQLLPNGQAALVAHSTSPIAMRERPTQRFQLRDVTDTPTRVLISRLPGAAPQRLWRETLHGESTAVSEIFVHS